MWNFLNPHQTTRDDLVLAMCEAEYLGQLSEHHRHHVLAAAQVKVFPADTPIAREGDELREVYLILKGMVSVAAHQNMSPSLWLYVSGPGTLVDTCALLDPPLALISMYAMTDVEALAIPRDVLRGVLAEEPEVGYDIMTKLSVRLALITRAVLRGSRASRPEHCRN